MTKQKKCCSKDFSKNADKPSNENTNNHCKNHTEEKAKAGKCCKKGGCGPK